VQPADDPRTSGFGNPTDTTPGYQSPTDRPVRGTGGFTGPGVVPNLSGQPLVDPTAPNPQREANIQEMIRQQQMMQQQPQP
jgi:hypothetical protein